MNDRLPNAAVAEIDPRKLAGYCLDPLHPRGRNKARVFQATLGLTQGDAAWLEAAIKTALPHADAVIDGADQFGVRWRADLLLRRAGRFALVRTVWQIPVAETIPRLVTCFVVPRSQGSLDDA